MAVLPSVVGHSRVADKAATSFPDRSKVALFSRETVVETSLRATSEEAVGSSSKVSEVHAFKG